MTHRRIVIGDVHGYHNPLLSLLEAIAPDSDDEIYFLGDLIDRGPDSAKVVEFVRQQGYPCLRGNHEEMLLAALGSGKVAQEFLQSWLYSGGNNTLISYDYNVPQEHLDWFRALPTYLDLGDVWLVHAGVHPNIPLEEQNAEQFCWIRREFHTMEQPFFANKLIVTGHTITFTFPGVKPGEVAAGPGWLDIETGVYHEASGWLTALDITNKLVYQVNRKKLQPRQLPLEEVMVSVNPILMGTRRVSKGSFIM
jgi:serine/threonine protein phosphatase 1